MTAMTDTLSRRVLRVFTPLAFALVIAASLLASIPSAAALEPVATDPLPGGAVGEHPEAIRITFDEPLLLKRRANTLFESALGCTFIVEAHQRPGRARTRGTPEGLRGESGNNLFCTRPFLVWRGRPTVENGTAARGVRQNTRIKGSQYNKILQGSQGRNTVPVHTNRPVDQRPFMW